MTIAIPQPYAGVPVTFTATLSKTVVDGSVSFWANDPAFGLSPSIPVSNGRATLTWMPGSTGPANWITFGASFTPNPQQGTTNASATVAPMIVLPNTGPDQIAVIRSAASLVRGSTATVSATAASGAAARFTATGPCSVSATVPAVVTTTAPGSCVITAATWGGGSYLPGSATTTITVTAPPKKPAKPKPSAPKPASRT